MKTLKNTGVQILWTSLFQIKCELFCWTDWIFSNEWWDSNRQINVLKIDMKAFILVERWINSLWKPHYDIRSISISLIHRKKYHVRYLTRQLILTKKILNRLFTRATQFTAVFKIYALHKKSYANFGYDYALFVQLFVIDSFSSQFIKV